MTAQSADEAPPIWLTNASIVPGILPSLGPALSDRTRLNFATRTRAAPNSGNVGAPIGCGLLKSKQ